jgi:hypothetical protein
MRLLRMARALRGSVPPYVRAMRKSPCAGTVTWPLTSLVWQTVSALRPLVPSTGNNPPDLSRRRAADSS